MPDLLGPANAPFAVTARPADTRVFGSSDTFFKDCTSAGDEDGTDIQASFLNGILEQQRHAIRGNDVAVDNADDDMLLRAIRSQRANYLAAGGTSNALTVTPSPTFASLADLAGVPLRILPASANTGSVTLKVGALAAKALVPPDGSALRPGDLKANVPFEVVYVTATDQFVVLSRSATISARSWLVHSFNAGSPTIPSSVTTTLTATTSVEEQLSGSSMSSGIFTCGAADAGLWQVSGFVEINVTGYQEAIVIHNNTTTIAAGCGNGGGAAGVYGAAGFAAMQRLAAGDTIRVQSTQTSGGNGSPVGGRLTMVRVRD